MKTVYNALTLIFLGMTLLVCLITGGWIGGTIQIPDAIAPATAVPSPTQVALATWTPTWTPFPTEAASSTFTYTPSPTNTPTNTQTATETNTPTITPTSTITPTFTPSSTFTLTFTPTPLPTNTTVPSPTGDTPSPTITISAFPFIQDNLIIRQDFQQDCTFEGIGGDVLDLYGQPLTGIQVVVKGPGLPTTGRVVRSGANTDYGQSGWVIQVAGQPTSGRYTVQLRNEADGTWLSPEVKVTFTNSCSENLYLVSFKQVRPY